MKMISKNWKISIIGVSLLMTTILNNVSNLCHLSPYSNACYFATVPPKPLIWTSSRKMLQLLETHHFVGIGSNCLVIPSQSVWCYLKWGCAQQASTPAQSTTKKAHKTLTQRSQREGHREASTLACLLLELLHCIC